MPRKLRNKVNNFLIFNKSTITPFVLPVVERNVIPDVIVRAGKANKFLGINIYKIFIGIRAQLSGELQKVKKLSMEEQLEAEVNFVKELKSLPIAIAQDYANKQHYEVPFKFHELYLGPCMKYSSCYYPTPETTLEEAEIFMLEMYCERAGLKDGMKIVDLGCGWGSVTLYLAKKYPKSEITSISNSNSQREFIMARAAAAGLSNVQVFTGNNIF